MLKVTKTTKPAGLAYPLNKVKEALRLTGYNEEDGLTATYISAAVSGIYSCTWVDLQTTSFVGYLDSFEDFTIYRHPVTEITSIKYYDADGALTTMTANTDYYYTLNGDFAKIHFENKPSLRDQPFDNIEVTFKSGYLTHFEIPDDFINALLLLVGDSHEMRQSFSQGMTWTEALMPMGARSILNNNSKRLIL